jgi:hypothetical protein
LRAERYLVAAETSKEKSQHEQLEAKLLVVREVENRSRMKADREKSSEQESAHKSDQRMKSSLIKYEKIEKSSPK